MANTYLSRTGISGANQKKWTFSGWFKKSLNGSELRLLTSSDNSTYDDSIRFKSANKIEIVYNNAIALTTNRLFRDNNAYYHIVVKVDTDQASANDRIVLYINGVDERTVGGYSTSNMPGQGVTGYINYNAFYIGVTNPTANSNHFHGIMSHVHFTDGYAYDATSFGQYDANGVWTINTSPSVTYGTEGFFILKDGNSVTDQSPNTNNFTVGGGTLTKTEDNPSNVFNTFNYYFGAGNQNLLNGVGGFGGTQFSSGSTSSECFVVGNLAINSGKYYWEWKAISEHPEANFWGVADIDQINGIGNGSIILNSKSYVWGGSQGNKFNGSNGGSYGSQIDINNIGMVAVDMDNNKIWLGENGAWFASGNPATGANPMYSNLSGTITPFHADDYSTYTPTAYYNFGNGYFGTTAVATNSGNGYAGAEGSSIFNYQPPTGYSALSTKGLNL